jgi:hypothetical protein
MPRVVTRPTGPRDASAGDDDIGTDAGVLPSTAVMVHLPTEPPYTGYQQGIGWVGRPIILFLPRTGLPRRLPTGSDDAPDRRPLPGEGQLAVAMASYLSQSQGRCERRRTRLA